MMRSQESHHPLIEIATSFLTIGAMSYGGPAIMGIMQAEIQEKRQWVSKERFVEGLALVNALPGPAAAQLALFLGHARGGAWGAIAAGLGFILPAFFIMLALTWIYTTFGALHAVRGAFYGIGPVVLGIFAVAIYRLGTNAIKGYAQVGLGLGAAALIGLTPIGLVPVLLTAGALGLCLYHSRRLGLIALASVVLLYALSLLIAQSGLAPRLPAWLATGNQGTAPSLVELGAFFVKVGAFTFGGGLSILAFVEDQVVNQLGWLTAREFVDGLALGQLTPGPIIMLAAFVGYKVGGVAGATVAAAAIFLPSFVLMLSVIPALNRVQQATWVRAFMRGVGPAVIGALAVSLVAILPHAAPDPFAMALLLGTVLAILLWRMRPLTLMVAGGAVGVARRAFRFGDAFLVR
ncbi:MAG: chromate efflux transporter [Candidatus Rokuibacteriota bacterium]